MNKSITLWAPVLEGGLDQPAQLNRSFIWKTDQVFASLEEIKVRSKNAVVRWQGKVVAVQIAVSIACLLENDNQQISLLVQEEQWEEYINWPARSGLEQELNFLAVIEQISCSGILQDKSIALQLHMILNIYGVKEQLVQLSAEHSDTRLIKDDPNFLDKSPDPNGSSEKEFTATELLTKQIIQLQQEKQHLTRQIYILEQDLLSLKRGIKKAEQKNSLLQKQLKHHENIEEEFRKAIEEKEIQLVRYEDKLYSPSRSNDATKPTTTDLSLGTRVKRMFLES